MRFYFILMAFLLVLNTKAQNPDVRLLDAINTPASLKADGFNKFMSNSAVGVLGAVPLTIGISGLICNDKQMVHQAIVIASSVAVAGGVAYVLKYSVNRSRPFEKYSFIGAKVDETNPSFPSMHTSLTFSLATSLSLAYPRWYVIVPAYTYASTVAFSRMYLGVHYPSDVLGGMITGAGSAWITYKANQWLTKKYEKKHAKQL
jgi:undecaprenyl-diphosphatase